MEGLWIHDFFYEIREFLFVLFYNELKESMFTIEIEKA